MILGKRHTFRIAGALAISRKLARCRTDLRKLDAANHQRPIDGIDFPLALATFSVNVHKPLFIQVLPATSREPAPNPKRLSGAFV